MARYNFWYINGGEGIVVKDYEKNKQLTPQEVIDLLNDHDGMMTTGEEIIKDFIKQNNSREKQDEKVSCNSANVVSIALIQTILNGGK